MRRRFFAVAAFVLATACGVADDSSITEPTLQRPLVASPSVASCPANLDFATVRAMLLAVYLDGSPDENAALGKFNNIEHHFNQGSVATYQEKAWDLAEFTLDARDAGKIVGSAQELQDFLNALFCLVGLGSPFGPNSFFIYPSDLAQTIISSDGFAGVQIPAGNVSEPTLLTITPLTTQPLLETELDIYALYYDFEITNAGGTGWINPVVVGVCPASDTPEDVKNYLLLGHQDGTTFELLPEADASFLDCTGAGGSSNLVVNGDSTLVAAAVVGSAGVGGETDNFSPIAPVDSRVVGSSGEGGTADNFRPRRGLTPSMNLVSLPNVVCSLPITALTGTQVADECRPKITFATPTGNSIEGVNVAWNVESGAGSVATPAGCSPFSSSLSQATDVNGLTTVCWQLGATPGTNTVTATASPGGEAPEGVTFVYSEGGAPEADAIKIRFTATAYASTTTTVTCPASVPYNGSAQEPCSATVLGSDGFTTSATVTYTNNTNAGTAGASATYAGDANHTGSSGSTTFEITKLTATATAGSATILFGAAVPTIPCTVTGLLSVDAGTITCTTSVTPTGSGVFPTTPVVTNNNSTNYNVNTVNGALTVLGYVQVGCFSSPIFSSMPDSKSAQKKGSNLPVKCTLKWPNGSAVTNATGSLEFWSIDPASVPGTVPSPSGLPGYTIPGAFAPTNNGNYSHSLNTGNPFFVIGGAYYIRAVWSDGSITNGYFRIKQ